jgi:hypothetical protein
MEEEWTECSDERAVVWESGRDGRVVVEELTLMGELFWWRVNSARVGSARVDSAE